jgi:hypothetical protein
LLDARLICTPRLPAWRFPCRRFGPWSCAVQARPVAAPITLIGGPRRTFGSLWSLVRWRKLESPQVAPFVAGAAAGIGLPFGPRFRVDALLAQFAEIGHALTQLAALRVGEPLDSLPQTRLAAQCVTDRSPQHHLPGKVFRQIRVSTLR